MGSVTQNGTDKRGAASLVAPSRWAIGRLGGFHFRRQCVIRGFVADFYCHEAHLVIEVDGPVHDTQGEHDRERDNIMMACGLTVLRFTNAEVQEAIESVTESVYNAVREQARASS